MNLVARAAAFAEKAHASVVNNDGSIGQLRLYTKEPYIVHPRAVAAILAVHGLPDEVVAAGFLHDVCEDTPVTLAEIEATFGYPIRILVEGVTDVSAPSDGDRQTRKAIDREHVACAPRGCHSIKAADLIDNTASISKYDPGFAKAHYLPEKEAILRVITGADPDLLRLAWRTLRDAQEKLVQDALKSPGAG